MSTPSRLYDMVIGASTVGTYTNSPPLYVGMSSSFTGASVPAKSLSWAARSLRPVPEPPPEYSIVRSGASVSSAAIASL